MGQDKRTDILRALGAVSDDQKRDFDLIRTARRRYLHLYSSDASNVQRDAKKAYGAAVRIANSIVGHQIAGGQFRMDPRLMKYLQDRGVVRRLPATPKAEGAVGG